LLEDDSLDFSFSGLKTAVLTHVLGSDGLPRQLSAPQIDAVCAGFQHAVFAVLAEKMRRAIERTGCRTCVLAGGVAANAGLREALHRICGQQGAHLVIPARQLCTDNAAMVAASGYRRFIRHGASGFDTPVNSRVVWTAYHAT
jgi:N6-L-threonylcarbamoyladenine synthase